MRVMWVIFCGLCITTAFAEDDFTFSEIGHALCGYNQFRYNSECYDYDDTSVPGACKSVYGSACLNSFIYTSDELDNHYPFAVSYGNIGHAINSVYTAGGTCSGIAAYGSACLNSFIYTSDELDNHYPFEIGFSNVPYTVQNYANMLDKDCLGTMDGYYTISMSQYSKPVDSQCADGSITHEILNDCQHIDMSITDASDIRSPLHPDNMMCAVLCDYGFEYSNTGICMEYCRQGDVIKRLHILRDGEQIDFTLWAKAHTTPALHIKLSEKQVCHLNLAPGKQKDALHIRYQDTDYHSTK